MASKNELKEKANSLPLLPGVYIMRNSEKQIIYIGKAKKLKNRVTQYFGAGNNHTEKVRQMVEHVYDFDYIVCDSEFEALTLENSLIKQHKPKYNILLKDDKGYHYIRIYGNKWKRMEAAKSTAESGTYLGPYNSGYVVKQTVDEAQKIYKIPNCNRSFETVSKPCLNYHIGRCMAPCTGKVKTADYSEAFNSAVNFVKNGGAAANEIELLKQKMEQASENLNFEYAAKLRDRIRSLNMAAERQKVITTDTVRHDVIAAATVGESACVQIFMFKNGHLADENHYIFDGVESKSSLYSQFTVQYYSSKNDFPRYILVDSEFEDMLMVARYICEKSGKKVNFEIPQIGEKKRLVEMCGANAAEHLSKVIERTVHETAAISELGELLGLKTPPRYIESYDISNIAGSNNVAGMVVFKDGRPYKSAYRKFKIKGFTGQDDFKSMAEVIKRRFEEYRNGTDIAFSALPDVILLDGGKGQISAVLPVLRQMEIDVPVFGMVKDNKHRSNVITDGTREIAVKQTRRAFTLVTNIQNEVHRYAISFHKATRTKAMVNSELYNIEGVGKAKAAALFKTFKSLKAIKNATVNELTKAPGISNRIAENIVEYFKN